MNNSNKLAHCKHTMRVLRFTKSKQQNALKQRYLLQLKIMTLKDLDWSSEGTEESLMHRCAGVFLNVLSVVTAYCIILQI